MPALRHKLWMVTTSLHALYTEYAITLYRGFTMQAIEFVTHVKNGIIGVPKEYLKALRDECRIIIHIDADDHTTITKKKKKLISLEVDTRGLFNRDEANER